MIACKGCKFWKIDEPQYIYGMCHRYPPVPDLSMSMRPAKYGEGAELSMHRRAQPIYANTHETDWCGEFASRGAV